MKTTQCFLLRDLANNKPTHLSLSFLAHATLWKYSLCPACIPSASRSRVYTRSCFSRLA